MNNTERSTTEKLVRDYTESQLLFSLELAQGHLQSCEPDVYFYWEEMVRILEFELESRSSMN